MNQKQCSQCKEFKELNADNFIPRKIGNIGWHAACKRCRSKASAAYEKKRRRVNPDYDSSKKARTKVKLEVLRHYGGGQLQCAGCPFTDYRALTLDHINGGGNQHRKGKGSGVQFYRWLKKNGYPDGIQVLCMNCQWIKRYENQEHTKPGERAKKTPIMH